MTFRRALLIAFGAALFLLASFLVALWLTGDNRERSAVSTLLRAQAAGDAPAMLALLEGCAARPDCLRQVRANAVRLRRDGRVRILDYRSGTTKAVTARSGLTRVAWDTGNASLPVVQCVSVERRGLPVIGGRIVLTAIGPQIQGSAACPG